MSTEEVLGRVRFTSRYIAARFMSGLLLIVLGIPWAAHPEWSSDTPVLRFLPGEARQVLFMGGVLFGIRWCWRSLQAVWLGRVAIEVFPREAVVRVDKQLREVRLVRDPGPGEITYGSRECKIRHAEGTLIVPTSALNAGDLARLQAQLR